MKKGLIFCLVAIAAILTGCKKDTESFDGITINQGASMEMSEGKSERLSVSVQVNGNVTPALEFTSSDPAKVMVYEDGEIYALSSTNGEWVTITVKGTAAVSNEKVERTATIKVKVVEFAQGLKFSDLYSMQPTTAVDSLRYAIYRIRYHRCFTDGQLTTDATYKKMHDYQLDTVGDMQRGDSLNPTALLPQDYEHWVYLKDTINSKGEVVKMGVFMDSIQSSRCWLLSSDCYFDEDGKFQCLDQGAILQYNDFFMFDATYHYTLGEREFVDDVTECDTIRQQDVLPMPYPGYIQIGHFDEDAYLQFMTDAFNEEEVYFDECGILQDYDSYFRPVYLGVDENGEPATGLRLFLGYPTGGMLNMESNAVTKFYTADYYSFTAHMYGNAFTAYCLKTTTYIDEEGNEKPTIQTDPLAMADAQDITYTVTAPASAPKRVAARRIREEGPVSIQAHNVKMRVMNTLGATFRMAVMGR